MSNHFFTEENIAKVNESKRKTQQQYHSENNIEQGLEAQEQIGRKMDKQSDYDAESGVVSSYVEDGGNGDSGKQPWTVSLGLVEPQTPDMFLQTIHKRMIARFLQAFLGMICFIGAAAFGTSISSGVTWLLTVAILVFLSALVDGGLTYTVRYQANYTALNYNGAIFYLDIALVFCACSSFSSGATVNSAVSSGVLGLAVAMMFFIWMSLFYTAALCHLVGKTQHLVR